MKNISIALVASVLAAFAASCQKTEIKPAEVPAGPMVINAKSEGIGTTKVEMAYRYDLLWQANDQIYVTDGFSNDTFTLSDGAGTTMGVFTQNGSASFAGEVKAYYPKSLASGSGLVWPEVQTNGQTVPMFSRKTVSGNVEDFTFASLGAVLQIVFNSTVDGTVLKSIVIKDGKKSLSGSFYVDENGQAVITAKNHAGITLDLGSGKALGKGANYFNLAIPAGEYDDVTISFLTTDMHVCTMHSTTMPEIQRNTVCRLTLTGTKFGDNVLPGEFSVGSGRVVGFSKGNLYWDGDSYEFEANQYDFPSTRSDSHIGHFFWSSNPAVARASSYSDPDRGEHDVFFTNDTEVTAAQDFTVDKITGRFRTLSMSEWKYLLNTRANAENLHKVHVSVCGRENSLVIAPDGFAGEIKTSYSEAEWQVAESQGLVCLPHAGFSMLGGSPSGNAGYYWSSAPWTITGAQHIAFSAEMSDVSTLGREYVRDYACAVRLVRDKEFVTAVTLSKTSLDLSLRQSVKLVANVLPTNAPVKNVIWTSDNPDVATVSSDGTVSGIAVGTATITATTENAFKTATCTVTVQPRLVGEFSVGSNKKVQFSRGNLYWDGDSYEFEANQYDFPSTRSGSHIGHFFWSSNPAVARASSYSDPDRGEHDVFFTNETEVTASQNFTVAGVTGVFRTLSMVEWKYLLNTRTKAENLHKVHVSVCGRENSLVIAPDGFAGEIKTSYSEAEWQEAESQGLVCLPHAGFSMLGGSPTGEAGYYWSSAPWTITGAQHIAFSAEISDVSTLGREYVRDYACAVRLVSDVAAE